MSARQAGKAAELGGGGRNVTGQEVSEGNSPAEPDPGTEDPALRDGLPVPFGAPFALGLGEPQHLVPGGSDPGRGGASLVMSPAAVPGDIAGWRPGDGGADTLRAFAEATGRLDAVDSRWLREWVRSAQSEAVARTGMRIPPEVLAAMSGGLLNYVRASAYSEGAPEPRPDLIAELVPSWVKDFRPGSGAGSFPDLWSFLAANKSRLPVNIWLEPVRGVHVEPLLRWTQVWSQVVREDVRRSTGERIPSHEMAALTGVHTSAGELRSLVAELPDLRFPLSGSPLRVQPRTEQQEPADPDPSGPARPGDRPVVGGPGRGRVAALRAAWEARGRTEEGPASGAPRSAEARHSGRTVVEEPLDRGGRTHAAAAVGVIVGAGTSELAGAAWGLPREENVFGVVLEHGMRDLDVIERAVRGSGWDGVEAVRLLVGESGDLASLAVGLRERLGVPVAYPTGPLWLGARGLGAAVRVGSYGLAEDGGPVVPDAGGGWVWQVEPTARNPEGRVVGEFRLPVSLRSPAALDPAGPRPLAAGRRAARKPEAPPADLVEWRPGAGGVGTLREFLAATGRAEAERPDWLRAWVVSMQQEVVEQTGMRMPAVLLEMFSGGLVTVKSVRAYSKRAPEPAPDAMVSLVPGWVLAFRAGSGPESFGDLLSFLRANKDRLPLNIWLEPDDKNRYSAPLVRWVGVWVRTVQEEALRKTGAGLKLQKLVSLTGGLTAITSVSSWVAGLAGNDADDAGGEAASGEPASLGEGAARPAKNVPEDVVWWRPGAGGADTLREFLEKTGRAEEEHPRWLRGWVLSVQQEAVEQTGMRVPTILLGVLSGDLVTR
ncbi:hypothetical protein AB0E55_41465, partial [Amycolatopsis keratiniphila]|uniref:hypothetical protein n=1 Tax=Amycolatopsis keratiniphila TaxID=129921 RepID=UPI00340D4616